MKYKYTLSIGAKLQSPKRTYTIEQVLGQGGFGITYKVSAKIKVENVTVRTYFAIKEFFMSDSCERDNNNSICYSSPVKDKVEEGKADFYAEAQRLNKISLNHPNIIHVNEVFEANNTVYYVMEYLDRGSLRSYVHKNGILSEEKALEFMLPIMKAVDVLHQNIMTHLDIKPDNIMLKHEEEFGSMTPVLIDFGLAKHYDEQGRPTSRIRNLGCSEGYAPIEQYTGIYTFTPQADVYALAATLLYLLTGRDPVIASDQSEAKILAILPDIVSIRVKNAIVAAMKMLKEERIQSVSTFMGMLEKQKKQSIVEPRISIMNIWVDKEPNEELNESNLTILSLFRELEIYGLSSVFLSLKKNEDVSFLKEIIYKPDELQTRGLFKMFLSNHDGNVWLGENIITYRSLDDFWQIKTILKEFEEQVQGRMGYVRLVREMDLWALCYDSSIERTLCLKSDDAYCLFESGYGTIAILETGIEGDEISSKNIDIECVDTESVMPLFVLGSMIYYKTWFKHRIWDKDIVLYPSFPFPIDIYQKGIDEADYSYFFRLVQKHTTVPFKNSAKVDSSILDIELRMDNYKCYLDVDDIFGYRPKRIDIVIDIDLEQNISLVLKEQESGIEKKIQLPIFEKFEDIPFKAETRQEQTSQGKLTDPIKAKLSLKERLFKMFGKK